MPRQYPITEEGYARLNNDFYENYQHNHWFYKIKSIDYALNNIEEVEEEITEFEYKVIDHERSRFSQTLEMEMVLQFYHISEALFSLMLAVRDSGTPWLMMKYIGFDDICEFIRDELLERELTREDYREWFYYRAEPAKGEESLEPSLEFISEYLPQVGRMLLNNDVYNEYKHGLRVHTGYSQMTAVRDDERKTVVEGKSMHYLDQELLEKEGSDEVWGLSFASKSYDYNFYYRLGYLNFHLIRNLIVSRQLDLDLLNEDDVPVGLYGFGEDAEEVFATEADVFEVKTPYPTGDWVIKIG